MKFLRKVSIAMEGMERGREGRVGEVDDRRVRCYRAALSRMGVQNKIHEDTVRERKEQF